MSLPAASPRGADSLGAVCINPFFTAIPLRIIISGILSLILTRSNGPIYDVLHLPSEIKKRRRNHLRHKDDIEVFSGVDPEECGRQAPPVKIPFAYRAGCDRVSGGGKPQSKSDPFVTGFLESAHRHLC